MLCCYCMGLRARSKEFPPMSLHRVLIALLSALGVAVLFSAMGWQWAFWVVVLGTVLGVAWPLLSLLFRGR